MMTGKGPACRGCTPAPSAVRFTPGRRAGPLAEAGARVRRDPRPALDATVAAGPWEQAGRRAGAFCLSPGPAERRRDRRAARRAPRPARERKQAGTLAGWARPADSARGGGPAACGERDAAAARQGRLTAPQEAPGLRPSGRARGAFLCADNAAPESWQTVLATLGLSWGADNGALACCPSPARGIGSGSGAGPAGEPPPRKAPKGRGKRQER
jgi:hypothetical protein